MMLVTLFTALSVELGQHLVGVLAEVLEEVGEPGHARAVDHAVVCRPRHRQDQGWHDWNTSTTNICIDKER